MMKTTKDTILQFNIMSHVRFMWVLMLSFTIFFIFMFHSHESYLTSWSRRLCSEQVQQKTDLTYWRFNYTDPDDLDDILSLKPPEFLRNYKNPCWNESRRSEKSINTEFKIRCLPYFYLIGADKCGTTDMFLRLLRHPEIMPTDAYFEKETMWWAWKRFGYEVYSRGHPIAHFLRYLEIFDSAIERIEDKGIADGDDPYFHNRVFGDGSPNNLWDLTGWNKIPQNHGLTHPKFLTPHCIHHLTPKAKLIVLLRNPIDRLYSDFLFIRLKHQKFNYSQRVFTRENFHTQVVAAIKKLRTCTKKKDLKFCLFSKSFHLESFLRIQIGFYSMYLKEWLKVFPRNQFYISRSEDYKANITQVLSNIFQFLDLSELSETDLKNLLKGRLLNSRRRDVKDMPPMFFKTRKLLMDLYQPFNNELAALLKDDKFRWDTGT